MKEKEELFREKAKNYLVCFNDVCPRHNQCLRWEVGRYIDQDMHVVTCVNPHYRKVAKSQCSLFRDNSPILMPIGMRHLYYDMPAHIAVAIKKDLIESSSRATYYHYHCGRRPICTAMQAQIEKTCRRHGWKAPLQFDYQREDYVW